MPIRNIRILAGDGTSNYTPSHGSYPTYRGPGVCKAEDDPDLTKRPATFTDVSGKACTTAPFSYSVLYDCPGPDLYSTASDKCDGQATKTGDTGWNTNWFDHGCWDSTVPPSTTGALPGACIFRPRIQVQDAWG